MLVPERFHHVNSVVCLTLGTLFNSALLVLLARHSTAEMATLRPVLALTSLVDLACVAATSLTQLVVLSKGDYSVVFSVGPLWWVPQPYAFVLISLVVVSYMLHNNALTMMFVVRYLIVCRGSSFTLRQYIAMFSVPLALALSWVVVFAKTGYVSTPEQQHEASRLFFFFPSNESTTSTFSLSSSSSLRGTEMLSSGGNNSADPYVIGYFRRPGNKMSARGLLVYPIINYSLVAYFGWRIYRHLITMAEGHLSGQEYRALQLQLSSTLLLQSLAPLVATFAPTVGLGIAAALGLHIQNFSAYYMAILSWELVVNPLIVIWVVRAYRQVVGEWLTQLKKSFFPWGRRGGTPTAVGELHGAIQSTVVAVGTTREYRIAQELEAQNKPRQSFHADPPPPSSPFCRVENGRLLPISTTPPARKLSAAQLGASSKTAQQWEHASRSSSLTANFFSGISLGVASSAQRPAHRASIVLLPSTITLPGMVPPMVE